MVVLWFKVGRVRVYTEIVIFIKKFAGIKNTGKEKKEEINGR